MPTQYRDVMDDTFDNSSDHFSKINRKNLTTFYEYNSQEQEFVFCCKGKPFATLVSSNLPTPTCNLIDFDLVRDLGLKMTDLQCRKFYFAGNKFRVLGKVSTTVQCIEEGALSGANFHIKGLVVSDLNKTLDSHCVAGVRMKEFLLSSVNKSPDDLHVSSKAPDDLHVSLTVPDDPHVSSTASDDLNVSLTAPGDLNMSAKAHDAPNLSSKAADARNVPSKVPEARHVSSKFPEDRHVSSTTGARPRHINCVGCHQPLGDTIDKDHVRCTSCHENLLMMLAKMPHKWFQPAFREEMAAVRGIQCKADYSDLELSDSDASSYCSQESPFRRDWGREPWKRDWEERLKKKRRK